MPGQVFQASHGFVRGERISFVGDRGVWVKAPPLTVPGAVVFRILSGNSFELATNGVLEFATPQALTGQLEVGVGQWISPTRLMVNLVQPSTSTANVTPAPVDGPTDAEFEALTLRVQSLEAIVATPDPLPLDPTNRIWFGA